MICWKCREPCQGVVCPGCGALQPPPPQADLFAVLGLERRYHLDRKAIDSAWRAASRQTHPDRFAGAPAVERRMALQWTATLNQARRALRDPVSRAWYLATGTPRPPERGGPTLPPDFLEDIFDLRMMLVEDPDAVADRVRQLKADLDGQLDARFTAWEQAEASLDEVPALLSRLKYVDNLLQEL
ncbi:MAG: hypothetical protein H6739_27590 [Alphaproteobacteria bacterium]|nr:hypothetical protein [Alphaproteobacteria bacterium]